MPVVIDPQTGEGVWQGSSPWMNNPAPPQASQPYYNNQPNANENTRFIDPLSFDSPSFSQSRVMNNEGTQDQIFRMILEQLQSARARYNRLGTTTGATPGNLSAVLDPLKEQLGRIDAAGNDLSGLTGELVRSGLGSTSGASMAAVNAARMSDARYGGGGNAAMLAERAAVDAAGGSSAALSQALVQGRLGEANYRQGLLNQRSGVATALSQVLQQQAGLLEDRGKLGVAMETELGQLLTQPMNVYGQLTGIRDQKSKFDQMPSIFGLLH